MPAMPEFFLWGLAGLIAVCSASDRTMWQRLLTWVLALSASLVLIAFWFVGARAYAADVAIIETELVETARWLQRNTSSQMVIAAHEIGALGYFAERSLIDLAGLVSPEVIPFIRDEKAIREYLNRSGADYLVTFPG
jgi:hypothetical protein